MNRQSSTPSRATSAGNGYGAAHGELGVVGVHPDLLELVPGDRTAGLW
ncbi:hypothetical protein AB0K20_28820 [Micromonospora matsumotoense]